MVSTGCLKVNVSRSHGLARCSEARRKLVLGAELCPTSPLNLHAEILTRNISECGCVGDGSYRGDSARRGH